MELAGFVIDSILSYIGLALLVRSLIWFICVIMLTILEVPLEAFNSLYEKFSRKCFVNYRRSNWDSYSFIFRLLYFLRKLTGAVSGKKCRLLGSSRQSLIGIIAYNLLKVDLLNVLLLVFASLLVENDGNFGISIEALRNLIFDYGILFGDFISTHMDILMKISPVVLGFWIFNIGSEWIKLKEVARKDFIIKDLVIDIWKTINYNCEHHLQLKYTVVENCKNRITDNIGYDYYNNQLIKKKKSFFEKKNSVTIKSVNIKFRELLDSLNVQKSNNLTGVRSTYYSFWSLIYDELYYFDNIASLEKAVLSYDESDNNFQYVCDYFKKYHNQIYKHEFTNARVINNQPLDELDRMKDNVISYLDDIDDKSKLLIWKYIYLKEAFGIEVNRYLRNRKVFYEFHHFLLDYHIERLLRVKLLIF